MIYKKFMEFRNAAHCKYVHGKYHEIIVFLKYHEKLYFLKYFYAGLSVRTNFFFQKYNWKCQLSAVLGTVIKCPKGTGSKWEKNMTKSCVFYKQYICSVEDCVR